MWNETSGDSQDEQNILYGLTLSFLLLLVVFYQAIERLGLESVFFRPCIFLKLTGWYCPGCGGTRAFTALLHGSFRQSFILHPFVPYMTGVVSVFLLSQTVSRISHRRISGIPYSSWMVRVGLYLLLVNWVIKNLLLTQGTDLLR